MDLNTYPWSPLYGWCADQFGVNWQIMKNHESHAKLAPNLMFNGVNNGKASEAIDFYSSLFPNSEILHKALYEKGEHDTEGNALWEHTSQQGGFRGQNNMIPVFKSADDMRDFNTAWNMLLSQPCTITL